MIQRRQINAGRRAPRVRSLLSGAAARVRDFALAVEDRIVWGGGDRLRGVADALKWPFERAAWALERKLAWPLAERADGLGIPLRGAGVAAVGLIAVGAGVVGLTWASSGGGATSAGEPPDRSAVAAVVRSADKKAGPAVPSLQGAAPDFTPEASSETSKGSGSFAVGEAGEATGSGTPVTPTTSFSTASSSPAATKAEPAGPAAMKVARQFAGAFVLYETGQTDAGVRTALGKTASPRLTRALLQRPPRLPANVKVPKAKVVNIVPGPKHGGVHTLSVSLLRVGVTSELRIDVAQDDKSGDWQVTDVLG